jgi:hypothetical protein
MYTNPKENRTRTESVLLEQFRKKGYQCKEIKEQDATTFIIRHEKKNTDVSQLVSETYKDLLKKN